MGDTLQKCCTTCKAVFFATSEFFHRDKNRKDGLSPRCKVCTIKWHKEHRQYLNAKAKEWQENHTEQYKAYQREYLISERGREKRRRYARSYYLKHHEQYLEYFRARDRTRDRTRDRREYLREYRKRYLKSPQSRELQRASRARYYLRHPEARSLSDRKRRARKMAIQGIHTDQQIQDLLKRQRYRCYYCSTRFEKRKGKYIYHVDHTFPLSRVAGTTIPANDISYLVLACPACNMSKGNKFPWEWHEGGRLL